MTKDEREAEWDNSGSQKWTYFANHVKNRVDFFLEQRLDGENIELGGGWYLHYPGSTVVDLSSVCLENNPAKEKLQFDLDELGNGKRLPYSDGSFDSATMVSVWQYLKRPEAVVDELERILKKGAELYLINGQSGGLEGFVVNSKSSQKIQEFFDERGYDTLREAIPTGGWNEEEFQSVCVAFPKGERLRDKNKRWNKNWGWRCDPEAFENAYRENELKKCEELLEQISEYPVTKYSQGRLKKIEAFSQEYYRKTGVLPIAFANHAIEPEVLMATPDEDFMEEITFIGKGPENENKIWDKLSKKYGLRFIMSNYLEFSDKTRLIEFCKKYDDSREREFERLADFLAKVPLNSFTKKLQDEIYQTIKRRSPNLGRYIEISNFDKQLRDAKAYRLHFATWKHKQKRHVEDLIRKKREILDQGIETVGTRRLDYKPYLKKMGKYIQ